MIAESLEQMGAYAGSWRTARRRSRLRGLRRPAAGSDVRRIYERQGAVLLKTGDKEKAAQAFEKALQVVEEVGRHCRWCRRSALDQGGLHVDCSRVLAEQRRSHCSACNARSIPAGRLKPPDDQLPPHSRPFSQSRLVRIPARETSYGP